MVSQFTGKRGNREWFVFHFDKRDWDANDDFVNVKIQNNIKKIDPNIKTQPKYKKLDSTMKT